MAKKKFKQLTETLDLILKFVLILGPDSKAYTSFSDHMSVCLSVWPQT